MGLRNRLGRPGFAVVTALSFVALSAIPASAMFESSTVMYVQGDSGGMHQCAQRTSSFDAVKHPTLVGTALLNMTGLTAAFQGASCNVAFGLPAGWVREANFMQRADGHVVWNTGYVDNAAGSPWAFAAHPTIDYEPSGTFYQAATLHQTAILGGWQNSGWASNWLTVPS